MSELNPSGISISTTAEGDPRIGHWLSEQNNDPEYVIVGFPSDKGVRRNGGRPGASEAPDAIRKQLYRMTPSAEYYKTFVSFLENCKDVGNVEVTGDLEKDHERLGNVVAGFLEQGVLPIILGGGHETAFGHFLGYAKSEKRTSIFNLDAHSDVRPLKEGKAHSGSPFRQALEHESNCGETYLVAGLQPHSVAQSHLTFINDHDGHYKFRDETNITAISGLFHRHESEQLMVTFDLDAVDQSQAPGVSAPCTNGLPADLWLTSAYLAGRNEKVTSFDISELNPNFDRDAQTAKLAALTVWHFMLGLSQR
ncbi:formimidoylglutamase [Fodinibius saliphilus]|uniref:formimidoylglutamase n=1 Tax=Fodinibius saliphilus TaxID=1920650 RepID=UPI0014871178|nr:formimidoylglutamase [Fodinibius saliphilus]